MYITKLNSVAINLNYHKKMYYEECLAFLMKNHNPLKEIKSIRPPIFYININPMNKKAIKYMRDFKFKKIQLTYSLNI